VRGDRPQTLVVQQRTQFAALWAGKADPSSCPGKPGDQRALAEALRVDRNIEAGRTKRAEKSREVSRQGNAAGHHDQTVDIPMTFEQGSGAFLDGPSDERRGETVAQSAENRHRLNAVSDRAEAAEEDPGRHRRHRDLHVRRDTRPRRDLANPG
jgi:hypothetical protein